DRLARRGGSLRIETFSDGRRFADAANELDAFVVAGGGPQGGDAVVFWLPRARLLFVGESGVARAADGSSCAGPEALALREPVRARKLEVERLLPALAEKGATGPIPFDAWVKSLSAVERQEPAAPRAPQGETLLVDHSSSTTGGLPAGRTTS